MVVENYTFMMVDQDRPIVYREHGHGFVEVGQAATEKSGRAIVVELNRLVEMVKTHGDLRERIIDAVNDAVENCFEEG